MSSFYTSGFYASYLSAVRAVSLWASFRPSYFAGLETSVVVNVESSFKDVLEIAIDDESTKKKVALRLSNRQMNGGKKYSLPSFRSPKGSVSLLAASRKPCEDFAEVTPSR